jgi:hypothetical protein
MVVGLTMRRNNKLRLAALAVAVVILAACSLSGDEVPYTPLRPDKFPPNSPFVEVRVALYINTVRQDEARSALETLGGYYIEVNGVQIPYFDYVVIGGGLIKRGKYSPVLELSDDLREILRREQAAIQRLRSQGIKTLLGIKGGQDGVSIGNIKETSQQLFARQCADVCTLYEFDGVEFWDTDGDSADAGIPSPYPQYGATYSYGIRRTGFDGIVEIPSQGEEDAEEKLAKAWKEGGKNMSNVMSYLMGLFGAGSSFQGDVNFTHKFIRPILVRETGYGRWLPGCPERFDFDSTLTCMTYGINDTTNASGQFSFGAFINGTETGSSFMSGENKTPFMEATDAFMSTRDYGPTQIDLSDLTTDAARARLRTISEKLGRSGWQDGEPEVLYDCLYGMVYYINIQPYSTEQLEYLSITSREVFGQDVQYLP